MRSHIADHLSMHKERPARPRGFLRQKYETPETPRGQVITLQKACSEHDLPDLIMQKSIAGKKIKCSLYIIHDSWAERKILIQGRHCSEYRFKTEKNLITLI